LRAEASRFLGELRLGFGASDHDISGVSRGIGPIRCTTKRYVFAGGLKQSCLGFRRRGGQIDADCAILIALLVSLVEQSAPTWSITATQ
jgi:hypothetical protein